MDIAEIQIAVRELKVIASKLAAGDPLAPSPEFKLIVERLETMLVEIQRAEPDTQKLARGMEEIVDLHKQQVARVIEGWSSLDIGRIGSPDYIERAKGVIDDLRKKIVEIAEKRTAAIQERIAANDQPQVLSMPPRPKRPAEKEPGPDGGGGNAASTIDKMTSRKDHEFMTAPSREELDAKLETIEARMDGRVAAIQASIESLIGRMEERALRNDERVARIEVTSEERFARMEAASAERFARMEAASAERFARIEVTSNETQSQIRNLKSTMIVTALSAVIAIVLGVAAFNATVLANMVSSFESGKSTAAAQAEVRRQTEETAALIRELQKRLEQSPPRGQKKQ